MPNLCAIYLFRFGGSSRRSQVVVSRVHEFIISPSWFGEPSAGEIFLHKKMVHDGSSIGWSTPTRLNSERLEKQDPGPFKLTLVVSDS